MRTKSIVVLACLAVASLVVPPDAGRSAPQRPDATMDLATAAARLDALHVRITGNRAERQASELLNYHRIEGGTAACVRATGREYRPPPFASGYDEFTDADLGYGSGSGSVLDSITDPGRSVILNALASARLARAGVLDARGEMRPHDSATVNRCTAPYQHRLYSDLDPPAGVYPLAQFPGLLDGVERNPAVLAAMRPYRSCMKSRYGYDVDERTDFLFAPRLSYTDAPLPGHKPGAAWRHGVRQVRAAFAADVDCRLPAYRIAMRLVAPRLAPWERQHRAELAAVRKAWRECVDRARSLPRTIPA